MSLLTVRHDLPAGLLARPARRLHELLDGPTLIHLPGARQPPLFVSVLMHGNETTGWRVLQNILGEYGTDLPRALSIFIGNVSAARYGKRRLARQPDYNRIWSGDGDTPEQAPEQAPEHAMVREVIMAMSQRGVFASIDIHNNSGINPHYACVNRLQPEFLNLARRFSRMVIYFTRPSGVQSLAFARLCPAVTLECGQPGDEIGIQLATRLLQDMLVTEDLSTAPTAEDIDLYHTVAIARVPPEVSISFNGKAADVRFIRGIEQLNFEEIPAGTRLADLCRSDLPLTVTNEGGDDVGHLYFDSRDATLTTRQALMPSMLTANEQAVRQDCLCYLMERYDLARGEKPLPEAPVWNE